MKVFGVGYEPLVPNYVGTKPLRSLANLCGGFFV